MVEDTFELLVQAFGFAWEGLREIVSGLAKIALSLAVWLVFLLVVVGLPSLGILGCVKIFELVVK